MSESVSAISPRHGWYGLGSAMAGRSAFSAAVLAWWCVLLSIRALILDSTLSDLPMSTALRALAITLLVAASTFGLSNIAFRFLRSRDSSRPTLIVLTAACYVVISAVVALAQILVDPRLPLVGSFVLQRTVLSTLALLLVLYCVDQRRHQLDTVAVLVGQRQRLERQRRQYSESLSALRMNLSTLVSQTAGSQLARPIQEIRDLLSGAVSSAGIRRVAGQVRHCASGVVRELSHALDTSPTNLSEPSRVGDPNATQDLSLLRKGRTESFRHLLAKIFLVGPFTPIPFGVFACVVVLLGALQVRPPMQAILAGIVIGAVTACFMWLANRFVAPHLATLRLPLRLVGVLAVVLASAGISVGLLLVIVVPAQPIRASIQIAAGFVIFSTCAGIVTLLNEERRRVLRELSSTVEGISWESSRLQNDELAIRRDVASLLHSDIQGRLAAVAARLVGLADAIDNGNLTPSECRADLVNCADALDQTAHELTTLASTQRAHVPNLSQELAAIRSAWAAVMVVRVNCPADVLDRIEAIDSVSSAVATAVREGISNALRHGNADHVDVDITVSGESVRVLITDDGSGVVNEFVPGLGLTTMMRAGANVRLASLPSGTELSVTIPATPSH